MSKKVIKLVISSVLLFLGTTTVFSETLSLVNKEISSLNLSSSQKQEIKEIRLRQESKINKLVSQYQKKKKELNQLLTKNDSDQILINELRSEIKNFQAKISQERIKSWIKVKALLTREQKEKLRNLSFKN